MAEDSDLERTEPASQKRLDEARERGQVPRSPELSTFAVLMTGGSALLFLGGDLMEGMERLMSSGLTLDRADALKPELMIARLNQAMSDVLITFLPYLGLLFLVALAAPMLVSGWLFTLDAVAPKYSRINPVSGLGRIFSAHGLGELGKAIGKTLVIGTVAVAVMRGELEPILGLVSESVRPAIAHLGHLLAVTFLFVVGALALIVAIDVPLQIWNHRRQLRMTKEEVKQEYKESEGDPHIKGRIRQLQRERARRRMMSEVPKADVVVTNPTHYAVALRYRERSMRAPMVVALGSSHVAERIVALARENNVPVLRSPPLARALHAHAELDREIPSALYTAVAEVLAYVYQLSRYRLQGGDPPDEPGNIPVPPELDPALDGGED
jgi:flagellar biosynthetic protein FlhB